MLKKCALVCSLLAPIAAQGWADRTGPNGPAPRRDHAMCYDPIHGYTLMVGSYFPTGSTTPQADTWSWDGSTWTARGAAPLGAFQGSLLPYAMVWHAATAQLLLIKFEVSWPSGSFVSYVWDGTTWTGGNSSGGTVLYPGGQNACAAYDPVHQETIAFHPASPGVVAVWDGVAWTNRVATSPAVVNSPAHMSFDPVSNRILLVGRDSLGGPSATRFYEWSGFGWNLRLPVNYPAWPGVMGTDTLHQRVVMFDGDWVSFLPNHTWTAANGVLTRLTTPIEPSLRERAAMSFDPVRGVCVLFGGYVNGYSMGDTWEFDLGPTASFAPFGGGCLGSRGTPVLSALGSSTPRLGTTFQAHVTNLPWTGPAFLLLGVSNTVYANTALPIDLGFLGAPTCNLVTSIEQVDVLTNVLGAATWSFLVPPVPGASFYMQVMPLDPGQNALGLTASNGGHGIIGL